MLLAGGAVGAEGRGQIAVGGDVLQPVEAGGETVVVAGDVEPDRRVTDRGRHAVVGIDGQVVLEPEPLHRAAGDDVGTVQGVDAARLVVGDEVDPDVGDRALL